MAELVEEKPYYHLCGQRLGKGSIIKAGNWGRILKAAGWTHNLAMREYILEESRKRINANAPSRYESAFCFETLEQLHHYRANVGGFAIHVAHRVKFADVNAKLFITYHHYAGPNNNLGNQWPDVYWQGIHAAEHPINSEVLTTSDLIVEDCLE